MLGLTSKNGETLRTLVGGVCRLGTLCGVFAMLMLVMGCPQMVCTEDADCDDGMVCTADTCGADGMCVHTDIADCCTEDADCDDGDFCNGTETCGASNTCVAGTDPCPQDGQFCNGMESCDEAADDCVSSGNPCDPNTQDCDEAADQCVTLCTTDADCDDTMFCNGTETCGADGTCEAGTDPCPDNGVFCDGTESCDETADACESSGDPCAAAGQVCDEDTDMCIEGTACNTDADCPDDNVFCNGTESCDTTAGVCVSSGDPCTAPQTCDEDLNQCVSPPGETFDFTLSTDTLAGTGGDDTFRALLVFNPPTGTNVPTLQTGDTGNGGDGTDELNPAQFNFAVASTVAPTLTNIETINITDFGTAATTVSGTNITGATAINFSNSTNANAFTVNNLPNLVDVGISQQGVGATLAFQNAASNGDADVVTMTFNGMTAGTVTFTTGTTNGMETLNIVSNSNSSTVADIAMNGTTLTTVNVSGDANFTHTATLDANVKTLNASAATGKTDFTQSNAGTFTYTGGAGDDEISFGGTFDANDTVDGGDGTDTLESDSADLSGTTSTQTNVSNFETISVTDALAGNLNLTHYGATNAELAGIDGTARTVTVPNNGSVEVKADAGAAAHVIQVASNSTSDTLGLVLNDADFGNNLDLTSWETVNLESKGTADGGANVITGTTALNNAAGVQKIVVTGATNLTFTGAVTADEIDASAFTGVLTVTAQIQVPAVVTGGTGNDSLRGSTSGDQIDGGEGDDTIRGDQGGDTLTGGSGKDTFQFEDTAANNGNDTVTDFGSTDILDFTAFATDDAPAGTVSDTGTSNQAAADNDIWIVTDADGSTDTAAEVAALFGGGGKPFAALAGNEDIVLLIQDNTNGNTNVWYVDNDATAAVIAGECVQVATLQGFTATVADANIKD